MTILRADARNMPLGRETVHTVVTSPPYNAGIEYGEHYEDSMPWRQYADLANDVAREMYRVLVPNGRAWINVQPAVPRNPQLDKLGKLGARAHLSEIWSHAMHHAGFLWRDDVIWVQDAHDGACAWGSWKSPSAPNLRGGYEVVQVWFKGHWKRDKPENPMNLEVDDLLGGPWTELVRNVWTLRPARRREGAPAPFPIELPARCIRLSTWPGETVLDPFAGSGTTIQAAQTLGRIGIGLDLGAKGAAQ